MWGKLALRERQLALIRPSPPGEGMRGGWLGRAWSLHCAPIAGFKKYLLDQAGAAGMQVAPEGVDVAGQGAVAGFIGGIQ